MPGLVPGIHALLATKEGVDGRDKPAMTNVGGRAPRSPDIHSANLTSAVPLSGFAHSDVSRRAQNSCVISMQSAAVAPRFPQASERPLALGAPVPIHTSIARGDCRDSDA